MRDYRKIKAWQLADDLTVSVYRHTRGFPREELYGLTSQIRRASYSVPANIVEGATRGSKKEYLHFLYIARGSLAETGYFVHLSHRLGYLAEDRHDELHGQVQEALKVLAGLIRCVESEAGKVSRTIARLTSIAVLSLGGVLGSSGLWSKV